MNNNESDTISYDQLDLKKQSLATASTISTKTAQ